MNSVLRVLVCSILPEAGVLVVIVKVSLWETWE